MSKIRLKIKKLLQSTQWIYFPIILFCLTPILWFWGRGGILINGVDTNFPLNPVIWFIRRFYVWNFVGNAGADFSSSTAGIFFHLTQVIPYVLGFNLQQVELFSLLFWFTTVVLSAFFLARVLFPNRSVSQLVMVSLYSFNTYLFNTWENVKVANIALVAAIPLVIATLILLNENKISYFRAAILFIVAGIILSGGGINPAYFAAFFLTVVIFLVSQLIVDFSRKNIFLVSKNLLLLIITITVTNLFWILPTAYFIFRNISPDNSINSLGFINWADSVSTNTSLLNILRVQGAWDWYAFDEQTGKPFYIPYATTYFYHFPFIFFSFLIPTLAILSFMFRSAKKTPLYITFGFMVIIGVFLGSGTHAPTGAIFRFLATHLPFFSLFRSPWYIFTPILTLAFACLTGLLFNTLSEKLEAIGKGKYNWFILSAALLFVIGNLIYSYPLISGEIFRPGRRDSFYMSFPSYVFDAKNWLASKNFQGRVVGYPDDRIENFTWGYRGVDSILHLISNQEIIFAPFNSSDISTPAVISELYQNMKKGEIENVKALAAKLNVQTIFEKLDQESLLMSLPPNIKNLPHTSFGKWNFYDLSLGNLPKIYSPRFAYFGYPYIGGASLLSVLNREDVLLNPSDSIISNIKSINNGTGSVIATENSQAKEYTDFEKNDYKITESLRERDLSLVSFRVKFLQNGLFQPAIERYKLEDFGFDITKDLVVSVDNQKATWGIDTTTDSWVFFKPQNFTKGEHKIYLPLKNDNLITDDAYKNFEYEKLNRCSKGESSIGISPSLLIKNQTEKDINCNFILNPFDTMQDYLVQVDYKHTYGYAPKVILDQKIGDHIVKRHLEQLPISPDWDVFSFYYHPHDSNATLTISLVGAYSPQNPLGTKVEYKDLIVKRVFSNKLVFLKKPDEDILISPEVGYKRVSPVEYKGEVVNGEGEYILVFSENYSPNWEITLYDKNQKKLDTAPKHFSANLYNNAWYVKDAPDDYSFRIFYKPQTLFYKGLIIFAIGIGSILVALFFIKKYVH